MCSAREPFGFDHNAATTAKNMFVAHMHLRDGTICVGWQEGMLAWLGQVLVSWCWGRIAYIAWLFESIWKLCLLIIWIDLVGGALPSIDDLTLANWVTRCSLTTMTLLGRDRKSHHHMYCEPNLIWKKHIWKWCNTCFWLDTVGLCSIQWLRVNCKWLAGNITNA